MQERTISVVTVELDGHRFGVPARDVQEILRAATPKPLLGAPAIVTGFLDVRGIPAPVYDVRSRFGLVPRSPRPSDRLLLVNAGQVVVIAVDQVDGLLQVPAADIQGPRDLPTATAGVAGVARLPDGMIVIFDLRTFLTQDEAVQLREALSLRTSS